MIHAMEQDSGIVLDSLKVDGGASANSFLMQFQSDLLGVRVCRPSCIETTALGAACLAGLSTGFWTGAEEIRENWHMEREFLPAVSAGEREKLLAGWKKAVRRTFEWAKEEP